MASLPGYAGPVATPQSIAMTGSRGSGTPNSGSWVSLLPGYTGPVAQGNNPYLGMMGSGAPNSGSWVGSTPPTQQQGVGPQGGIPQGTAAGPIANAGSASPTVGTQPATNVQQGTMPNALLQGLTQPVGSDLMSRMLNQQNAQATGGAVQQNDQLRNQAAASGFGAYNPALMNAQQQNLSNARGQVAQNNLQMPLTASQLNAQYGLGLGQLGALTQQNLAQEQLGQLGLGTEAGNILFRMIGGLL